MPSQSMGIGLGGNGAGGGVQNTIIVQDRKASGVNGGALTASVDTTRTLTDIMAGTDPDSLASISSNQITLQPGTYSMKCWAKAYLVNQNRLAIYQVTAPAGIIYSGLSNIARSANNGESHAFVASNKFTIETATTYEIRHHALTTNAVSGAGTAIGISGEEEVYLHLEINVY